MAAKDYAGILKKTAIQPSLCFTVFRYKFKGGGKECLAHLEYIENKDFSS